MTEPTTHAMTVEQWARVEQIAPLPLGDEGGMAFVGRDANVTLHGPHAVAAAALYRQPFGFTWQDVDDIRHAASEPWDGSRAIGFRDERLALLADRIAALLPPRVLDLNQIHTDPV